MKYTLVKFDKIINAQASIPSAYTGHFCGNVLHDQNGGLISYWIYKVKKHKHNTVARLLYVKPSQDSDIFVTSELFDEANEKFNIFLFAKLIGINLNDRIFYEDEINADEYQEIRNNIATLKL